MGWGGVGWEGWGVCGVMDGEVVGGMEVMVVVKDLCKRQNSRATVSPTSPNPGRCNAPGLVSSRGR